MYRVGKVLNHNSIIAINAGDNQEYLCLGKGVGFGKKTSEQFEMCDGITVYSLKETSQSESAKDIVKSVSPECLEISNEILIKAREKFGKVDERILFPLANHIEFAVKRIKNNEQISNPLTEDIKVLFCDEYTIAMNMEPVMEKTFGIHIDEHELGYIALHIHSATEHEAVSQSMQMAGAIRDCVSVVELESGKKIDVNSLAYNRLMNHVRFMVARALNDEKIKLNMNDYMEGKFPAAYDTAKRICDQIGQSLHKTLDEAEIGYLAMHIGRVAADETE